MTRQSLRIKENQVSSVDSDIHDATASSRNSTNAGRKRAQDDEHREEDEKLEEEHSRKRVRKSDSDENNQSVESSAKKTKQRMPEQFRKVRGRLGMLERLAKDVPLDVIFEIFCYLDPSDLLRLARTSNDLRGILMSKSSESIWRTARSNVEGLPPLPLDLNEPQYAHLLFESYCHVCNHKGRCDNILWSFRMRCCKSCAAALPSLSDGRYKMDLPVQFFNRNLLPQECIQGATRRHRRDVGNFQIAARLKAEFEALQTPKERDAWITRKSQERRAIVAHGRLCEVWHKARLSKRTDELSDIRKQRKDAILERLAEIGWREEAEKIIDSWREDEFTNHKAVKQPKKLTDYGWNSIKTELVEMLSTHKTERLAEEKRCTLIQRYSRLEKEYDDIRSASDLREPFPAVGDIFTYKVFENLIWETPEDEELTDVLFREKLAQHLPQIIEQWKPAKIQELVEIMQKSVPSASAADLYLATSVFECTNCLSRPKMHYPQMFYHPCCIQNPAADSLSDARLKTYTYGRNTKGPWMSRRIVWSDSGSRAATAIVESCFLDPVTATIRDLNSANPLIECTTCYADKIYPFGRAFMRWPFALAHSSESAAYQLPHHTLVFNSFGEEAQQILACEPERYIYSSHHDACCAHCHKSLVRSFKSLVDHFKANHSDIINVEKLEASSVNKPEGIQEHWYWNPCFALRDLGNEFRYRPPVAPVNVAATFTADTATSTTSSDTSDDISSDS
ncbi:hypothetical protein BT96DRAFT_1019525 [Gymnopus androsaceus JB14]|uniref:F-box domain-containing protein n=1 Tax=Gymnopus androsaceus JB14 TaxID=1447944 RepID=A0A6A4HRI1_9AGAR|nr:hypothetical protein BT96DRAFT_1019525 [Gymnopus androsaceus JB14]